MTEIETSIEDLVFDAKDETVFKIPDTKTRLDTLQNYFFPRFEIFLNHCLALVEEIYGIDPYADFTFVYRPSHRKDAKENSYYNEAYIGIAGKRKNGRQLLILNKSGKPRSFIPFYLTLKLQDDGQMFVALDRIGGHSNDDFLKSVAKQLTKNHSKLEGLFSNACISPTNTSSFKSFRELINQLDSESEQLSFASSSFYLPVTYLRGMEELITAFVTLFPVLHLLTFESEGRSSPFSENLDKLISYFDSIENDEDAEESEILEQTSETMSASFEALDLESLDNYQMVRASVRWNVFARDRWTCCSFGRTSKDNVTLEVDHILPRSKGGRDTLDNFQTLCRKCNIGKSNRDETNLRQII